MTDLEVLYKLIGVEEFSRETRLVIMTNAEVYAIVKAAAQTYRENERLRSDLEEARREASRRDDYPSVGGHGPGYD